MTSDKLIDNRIEMLRERYEKLDMIKKILNLREKELLQSIQPTTFAEIVEEVRASLPPSKYMRTKYMRNSQGTF